MNILSISLEKSRVTDINLLNWLTDINGGKGGKNCERYWLIKTDINITSQEFNMDVESIKALLFLCTNKGFHLLQIMKNV